MIELKATSVMHGLGLGGGFLTTVTTGGGGNCGCAGDVAGGSGAGACLVIVTRGGGGAFGGGRGARTFPGCEGLDLEVFAVFSGVVEVGVVVGFGFWSGLAYFRTRFFGVVLSVLCGKHVDYF